MNSVHIFVSFDLDHDRDLCDRLVEESASGRLGFEVCGRSERLRQGDSEHSRARRKIRESDQVIIICGEHTEASAGVFSELRIAREENKPYFLLWGRRESMCTKPEGAKSTEGIYGWTTQILRDQVTLTTRNAEQDAKASRLKRVKKD